MYVCMYIYIYIYASLTRALLARCLALSSQLRSLYQISNNGATVRKTGRDSYVDAIRTRYSVYLLYWYKSTNTDAEGVASAPLASGLHSFSLRIDESAGEDFCNHIGFVAGDGYRGSALNSADSCCVEVDSGRIMIDGRGSQFTCFTSTKVQNTDT